MFGVTHRTPAITSFTALSAASVVGFNQFAQAEPTEDQLIKSRYYQRVFDNSDGGISNGLGIVSSGQVSIRDNRLRSANASSGVVELSSLDGVQGFDLNGVTGERLGWSVAGAGDVNGDGFDDVIIGGTSNDQCYVVFGKSSGFVAVELSSLDGTDGFKLRGASYPVAGAGDVNGDGFADVIIGNGNATPNGSNSGQSYVVFGKPGGFDTVELSGLDGTEGFKLNGVAGSISGRSVAGAGDVNGDGFDDVIIGAYYATTPNGSNSGQSYVVFGKSSGFGTIELSSLDGTQGFKLNGATTDDRSGRSVAGAGDVNGDGFDDVITGAYYAKSPTDDSFHQSYVVFGKPDGFGTVELSGLDGAEGFKLNGASNPVAGAGDVNRDGFGDVIIGARFASPNGGSSGQSYVVFGKASGFSTVELSSLDGVEGFKLNGVSQGDLSGYSVAGAGDVNKDGFGDVIIGADKASPHNDREAGQSYVVFGKATDFGTVELSSLDGTSGVKLNGAGEVDRSGWSVSGAGDVNGDGFGDVIVGAPYADPNGNIQSGQGYVVFGALSPNSSPMPTPTPNVIPSPSPLVPSYPVSVSVSELNGGTGSILTGENNRALMGSAVSQAGDVNIDGIDDVIVGASGTIVNGVFNAGAGYVVFGDREGFPANVSVTELTSHNGLNLVGALNEMAFATSVSGAGDLNQDGIEDVVLGSPNGFNEENIQTGKAYVVYGSGNIFSQMVNVTQLDGKNGFALDGESYSDQLGTVVRGAGDINRDGGPDFMVSAPYASVDGEIQSGRVYVVFGDYEGSPSVFNVTALNGTNGFSITGENAFDHMGGSLSAIGDINGDGIDDVAIGAPEALADEKAQAGKVYVIFGHREGFSNVMQLSSLNGENGFSLNGAEPFDNFGASVSWSKVNDDRLSDIIIGAPNARNSDGVSSGRVYVFFGKAEGFLPQYNISLITPESGFILDGEQVSDKAGASVSGIGDFNVDGLQDMLIGAPQATANNQPRAGKGYVVFGQRGDYPSTIALSSLDGNNGFTIEGEKFGDNLGSSVSSAGDLNRDGASDVLLGAPGTDNGGAGYTALVYGGVSLFPNASYLKRGSGDMPVETALPDPAAIDVTEFV